MVYKSPLWPISAAPPERSDEMTDELRPKDAAEEVKANPKRAGCTATFVDPEFPALGRDTVYYARAFEVPSPTVNGQKPACAREESGECVEVDLCADEGKCLSDYAHRAWSSPIYVDHQEHR